MAVDIRQYTRVIIRKNGEYLFGMNAMTNMAEWRKSPFDAWYTRDKEEAMAIARITGGVMMLFNPVVGQIKIM